MCGEKLGEYYSNFFCIDVHLKPREDRDPVRISQPSLLPGKHNDVATGRWKNVTTSLTVLT